MRVGAFAASGVTEPAGGVARMHLPCVSIGGDWRYYASCDLRVWLLRKPRSHGSFGPLSPKRSRFVKQLIVENA